MYSTRIRIGALGPPLATADCSAAAAAAVMVVAAAVSEQIQHSRTPIIRARRPRRRGPGGAAGGQLDSSVGTGFWLYEYEGMYVLYVYGKS
jgi:hypothetical protein